MQGTVKLTRSSPQTDVTLNKTVPTESDNNATPKVVRINSVIHNHECHFFADGTTTVKVNGNAALALLDTGADVSCIDSSFLAKAVPG